MEIDHGLVYLGKIISLESIQGADFIASATVVCGKGGKWKGIVRKADFEEGNCCIVFLPDAQLDPVIHDYLSFMKDSNWRVKMRRFKGSPSEVLIIPLRLSDCIAEIGCDLTQHYKVIKYHKPISPHLQGVAKGNFPSFIPKTDELNYQRCLEFVELLHGKPYYITEKLDGSSTTAFRYRGEFGVCSRNLQLEKNNDNGYWKVAEKYKLEDELMDGYAIQWETCGPGIQKNPMGLKEIDGFMFNAYKIDEHRYLSFKELWALSGMLGFPMVNVIEIGNFFNSQGLETKGEGVYRNGKQREGVVIRSQENHGHAPISFKVINLGFEK